MPLDKNMKATFEKFAAWITELKLEHRDGQLQSDALTGLLILTYKGRKRNTHCLLVSVKHRFKRLVFVWTR